MEWAQAATNKMLPSEMGLGMPTIATEAPRKAKEATPKIVG